MADQIHIRHTSAADVYAVIFNAAGQVWNGSAFVAFATSGWTGYDVALAETAAGSWHFAAAFPAGVTTAGVYRVEIYEQLGSSPAIQDELLAAIEVEWDGAILAAVASRATPADVTAARDVVVGAVGALNDLSAVDVANEAAAALAVYDAPTAEELDEAVDEITASVRAVQAARTASPLYTAFGGTVRDVSIAQHEAGILAFECQNELEDPVDLTGHHVQFVITGGDEPITKGNGDGEEGLTILSPETEGRVAVYLSSDDTAEAGQYSYELWDLDDEILYGKGKLTVRAAHGPSE